MNTEVKLLLTGVEAQKVIVTNLSVQTQAWLHLNFLGQAAPNAPSLPSATYMLPPQVVANLIAKLQSELGHMGTLHASPGQSQ